jgi:N utilization substance protein B
MLNRRHIRIKVMQVLYAFSGSESDDFTKDQKFLMNSIDSMYELYVLMLSLMVKVQEKAALQLDKDKAKHFASEEEKNPNLKFISNEVLSTLKNNVAFKLKQENLKVNHWDLDGEYVDIIYNVLINSDLYKEYMKTKTSSFKEDKLFVVDFFKEIVAPNEKLYDYLEDKNLTWLDDLPIVNTAIVKLLKKVKIDSPDVHFTPRLYKDTEDKEYAINLFKRTLLNQNALKEEIGSKTKNWDADRIAALDKVLISMALCEIQKFPSIPTKVTINEYLEIAKEYSTPKSSIFINGILDKIVKEYQAEGKLNKIGRGLM